MHMCYSCTFFLLLGSFFSTYSRVAGSLSVDDLTETSGPAQTAHLSHNAWHCARVLLIMQKFAKFRWRRPPEHCKPRGARCIMHRKDYVTTSYL